MTTAEYLAQPSGPCCLKGTLHEGTPRGRYETIAELQTYITEPPPGVKANGNIILYFPDVWGFFTNGLLVMDAFADAGYLVLGVDYFRGDPVTKYRKDRHDTTTTPGFDFDAWKDRHAAFAAEATPRWVRAVADKYYRHDNTSSSPTSPRTSGGKPKFACVGYCFGAPYVCEELARSGNDDDGDDGIVSVGAFGHPAFLTEDHFRKLKKPLFMSCSETDHTFPASARRRALDILQEEGKVYHYQLFSGVEHGFALRGNPDVPYERWVKEKSLSAIVQWFDFWLAQK